MAVQEGFGGLVRIGLDEAAVAVGPVVDEAVGLLLYLADDFQGPAEITPGIARWVRQRHEHLSGLGAMLTDVVLDDGVPAVKAARVPDPPEDAVGGVALLSGDPAIII